MTTLVVGKSTVREKGNSYIHVCYTRKVQVHYILHKYVPYHFSASAVLRSFCFLSRIHCVVINVGTFINEQDFTECLKAIEEQLKACNGQSEYPLYIKGN